MMCFSYCALRLHSHEQKELTASHNLCHSKIDGLASVTTRFMWAVFSAHNTLTQLNGRNLDGETLRQLSFEKNSTLESVYLGTLL